MKKIMKWLLSILVAILVVPYLIPRDFSNSMSEQPYDNSVFFTTSDSTRLHGQRIKPMQETRGKILMIHGLGASSFSFRNNAPFFANQGYYVLAVDLPAFGYSSKQQGINHAQTQRAKYLQEWMANIDQQMNNTEPWHIVGHSMGGSTALAIAQQVPQQVASISLIAGAVTDTSDVAKFSWLLYSPAGEWLRVLLRYQLLTEKTIASILSEVYQKQPTSEDILGYLKPLQTIGSTAALRDFVVTANNVNIDDVSLYDIPLHLFWGENDTWVPPSNIEIIKEHASITSITMFPGGGHCFHEVDSTFNQALLDALATKSS